MSDTPITDRCGCCGGTAFDFSQAGAPRCLTCNHGVDSVGCCGNDGYGNGLCVEVLHADGVTADLEDR